jgi:hypothetical protein
MLAPRAKYSHAADLAVRINATSADGISGPVDRKDVLTLEVDTVEFLACIHLLFIYEYRQPHRLQGRMIIAPVCCTHGEIGLRHGA